MTKLIEFKNHKKETLRALLDKANSKKGVIFIHGFERTTVERKFKNIVDKLKGKVNLFRFDFSGCGLSDGRFEDFTIEKLTRELNKALKIFRRRSHIKEIVLISHSLGCVVGLNHLASYRTKDIGKVIFMAPAFNQKNLHRFWFTLNFFKEKDINWLNFQKYFNRIKKQFEKEMKKWPKMTKEHFLSEKYFLETRNLDYQDLFSIVDFEVSKILIVHGDKDDKVPEKSNDRLPSGIKKIIVQDGDHDLERPDMVKQYLNKLIKFILK